MMPGFLRIPRKALAAFLLLAAALSLLAPVCRTGHVDFAAPMPGRAAPLHQALHAAPLPDGSAQCCAYEDSRGLAMAMESVTPSSAGLQPLAPPSALAGVFALVFITRLPFTRLPLPRTPQSFYLRSARILR